MPGGSWGGSRVCRNLSSTPTACRSTAKAPPPPPPAAKLKNSEGSRVFRPVAFNYVEDRSSVSPAKRHPSPGSKRNNLQRCPCLFQFRHFNPCSNLFALSLLLLLSLRFFGPQCSPDDAIISYFLRPLLFHFSLRPALFFAPTHPGLASHFWQATCGRAGADFAPIITDNAARAKRTARCREAVGMAAEKERSVSKGKKEQTEFRVEQEVGRRSTVMNTGEWGKEMSFFCLCLLLSERRAGLAKRNSL